MPNRKKNRKNQKAKTRAAIARAAPQNQRTLVRIQEIMTTDEFAQFRWLHMVAEPWGPVGRMPLLLGNGVWNEDIYRYHMYEMIQVRSSGTGSALFMQEAWDTQQIATQAPSTNMYMNTTSPGNMLWATQAAYTVDTSPAVGAAVAANVLSAASLATSTSYGGANPTSTTHVVQTASGLRVRPISESQILGGRIMIAFTHDQATAPLTNVTYADVEAYSDDVCVKHSMALANWKPEQWLELVAIPLERDAFQSRTPPPGTIATVAQPQLGIFVTGANGTEPAVLEVQGVAIYQVESKGTDRVEVGEGESFDAPGATPINQHTRSVMGREKAQISTRHVSNRVTARVASDARLGQPHHQNRRTQAAMIATAKTNPTFWERIKGVASKGFNFLKQNWPSLLMKAIPLIASAV